MIYLIHGPAGRPMPLGAKGRPRGAKMITQIETELKNKSGIYGVFNKETNQIYVGSAQDLVKRFKEPRPGATCRRPGVHLKSDKSNV